MNLFLLLSAIVILACVLCNRLSSKLGVPTLLAFILLGMFFGCDGVVKIPFENYTLAQNICSVALIFIMFYGGFGTNWAQARPVAVKATVLSSLGTLGTAGLVGLFCWKVLGLEMLLGFLLGAVIASTDAASVFSILRSKHLDLKEGTASLLEVESGSNDPFSYMLTVILLSLMSGSISVPAFVYQVFAQLVYGGALGVLIALAARKFLQCFRFSTDGFDAVFLVAVALLSYVLPPTALAVALFLTFVARPVVVFLLMAPFRSSLGQILLVAWSGMRGAASIVFSILVITDPAEVSLDLYHIVFFIVLFSILLQGSLIPVVAKKLKMTDSSANVMKTFTDYTDEIPVQFLRSTLTPGHPWVGKALRELTLPPDSLVVLLLRQGEKLVPNGSTVLAGGDVLILSGQDGGRIPGVHLYEKTLSHGTDWSGRPLAALDTGPRLVILIRRGEEVIIPRGDTVLQAGDVLVINDPEDIAPDRLSPA